MREYSMQTRGSRGPDWFFFADEISGDVVTMFPPDSPEFDPTWTLTVQTFSEDRKHHAVLRGSFPARPSEAVIDRWLEDAREVVVLQVRRLERRDGGSS